MYSTSCNDNYNMAIRYELVYTYTMSLYDGVITNTYGKTSQQLRPPSYEHEHEH